MRQLGGLGVEAAGGSAIPGAEGGSSMQPQGQTFISEAVGACHTLGQHLECGHGWRKNACAWGVLPQHSCQVERKKEW